MEYPHKGTLNYQCLCSEKFTGRFCDYRLNKITVSFRDIKVFSYVMIYVPANDESGFPQAVFLSNVFAENWHIFQTSASFYIDQPFSIMMVLADENYFMAVLDGNSDEEPKSITISPEQRCPLFKEIAHSTLINIPQVQRVKYFHQLCQLYPRLKCFVDDAYFCQCTSEHDANCLQSRRSLECQDNIYCFNDGQCIQNQLNCPYATFCICSDCFFGDRCQYHAKGMGLTLDDMLRYELRPATNFDQQPLAIKISAALTLTMFVTGIINSIFSLMTFHSPTSRQVGVGIYLYASSINSLLTVTILNLKFWFLIITHIYAPISRAILRFGCVALEPTLRLFFFIDNWLNACVAIERAITVFKGVNFNKQLSQRIARWVILSLPFVILSSLVHELIYRVLFYDEEEKREWCILEYSKGVMAYSTFILSFHTLAPFSINVFSAVYIIIQNARRGVLLSHGQSYKKYLRAQLKEHRHLIISPLILATLSLPRVIISLMTGCVKKYRNPWLYLTGYFISFVPSVAVFIIFVLPSDLYKKLFGKSIQSLRSWIQNTINTMTRRS